MACELTGAGRILRARPGRAGGGGRSVCCGSALSPDFALSRSLSPLPALFPSSPETWRRRCRAGRPASRRAGGGSVGGAGVRGGRGGAGGSLGARSGAGRPDRERAAGRRRRGRSARLRGGRACAGVFTSRRRRRPAGEPDATGAAPAAAGGGGRARAGRRRRLLGGSQQARGAAAPPPTVASERRARVRSGGGLRAAGAGGRSAVSAPCVPAERSSARGQRRERGPGVRGGGRRRGRGERPRLSTPGKRDPLGSGPRPYLAGGGQSLRGRAGRTRRAGQRRGHGGPLVGPGARVRGSGRSPAALGWCRAAPPCV